MKRMTAGFITLALILALVLSAPVGNQGRASAAAPPGVLKLSDASGKISDYINFSGAPSGPKADAAQKGEELGDSGLVTGGGFSGLLGALSKMKAFYQYKAQSPAGNGSNVNDDVIVPDEDIAVEVPVTDAGARAEAAAPAATAAPAMADQEEAGGGYSETNTQVEGVDEADIVKTDGKNIYYSNYGTVSVFSGGARPARIATIKPTDADAYIQDLYLTQNYLVVNATYNDRDAYKHMPAGTGMVYGGKSFTCFYVYDISSPANPRLTRRVSLEGYGVDTRLIGTELYFVVRRGGYNLPFAESRLSDVLPAFTDSAIGRDTYVLGPERIYFNPACQNPVITLLGNIDISGSEPMTPQAFVDTSSNVYMNGNSLYITGHHWESSRNYTVIRRFQVRADGLFYAATARVPGYLLNQYSMDEYNGVFRIALTDSNSTTSVNRLYTLDAGSMSVLGSAAMARGERIYAVRFMGDTGYIVTYRQVDPLFVIDLKDPKAPKILGQLKVPGFSNYLHPFMSGYLVGIGRETTPLFIKDASGTFVDTGNTQDIGLKLSLFDVRDPKNPKEAHKLILGDNWDTSTEAGYNPKSIMVDRAKSVFAFPINSVDKDEDGNRTDYWSGGIVLSVSPEAGFKVAGTARPAQEDYYASNPRFCYIGSHLYFVSQGMLLTYDYQSFRKIAELKFQ